MSGTVRQIKNKTRNKNKRRFAVLVDKYRLGDLNSFEVIGIS